jgi:hypothetical protein
MQMPVEAGNERRRALQFMFEKIRIVVFVALLGQLANAAARCPVTAGQRHRQPGFSLYHFHECGKVADSTAGIQLQADWRSIRPYPM